MHYILPTAAGDELAWVTETMAVIGQGNTSDVEKVCYLEEKKLACSMWGDLVSLSVRDEFAERVKNGAIDPSAPDAIIQSLVKIGVEMIPARERGQIPQFPYSRGVIVATFGERVKLYEVCLTWYPAAIPVIEAGIVIAGDLDNHANLFPTHYYKSSGRSLQEALLSGIHGIRVAKKLKSQSIGDPNAWVYKAGAFRHLGPAELLPYIRLSDALDAGILQTLKAGPDFGFPATRF